MEERFKYNVLVLRGMKSDKKGPFNVFSKSLIEALGNNQISRFSLKAEGLEKIVESIEKKFKNTKSVQQEFGESFDEFLNEIVWLSYGLSYDYQQSKPKFTNEYEQRKKEMEKLRGTLCLAENDVEYPALSGCKKMLELKLHQQEEYCQRSMRMVDLFVLIDYLIEEYPEKYNWYNGFKNVKDDLTASFNENFFDNIYGRYKTYPGKRICLFNREKFCIGSYLHSAHPSIHYLDVKDRQDNLLATAILVEASGKRKREEESKNYLVIEGVLGETKTPEDRKKTFSLLWESIKMFAKQKNKDGILLNLSHAGSQVEPEEFLKFVFETEKPSEDKYDCEVIKKTEGGKETYQFKITHGEEDLNRDKFSYNLEILTANDFSRRVGGLGDYKNEQYLEMFFHQEDKKGKFYPFGLIGGECFCFEIPLEKSVSATPTMSLSYLGEDLTNRQEKEKYPYKPSKRKMISWRAVFIASILSASGGYGLANLLSRKSEEEKEEKETQTEGTIKIPKEPRENKQKIYLSESEKQAKETVIKATGFVGELFKYD